MHFESSTLQQLGLRIQLNHAVGIICPSPEAAHEGFRVVHTNGIHDVNIDYCGCERSLPHDIQLIRRRLYPATASRTRTCTTLEALKSFSFYNLCGKLSAYDFYAATELLSNNTGVKKPKVSFHNLNKKKCVMF